MGNHLLSRPWDNHRIIVGMATNVIFEELDDVNNHRCSVTFLHLGLFYGN